MSLVLKNYVTEYNIANIIVQPHNGKIPFKIMNTRNEDVILNYFNLNVSKLSDYYLCHFNKSNMNPERVKSLFSLLKFENLNEEEQKSI